MLVLTLLGCILTGEDRGKDAEDTADSGEVAEPVDLLFVLDASSSMSDESAALILGLSSFETALTDAGISPTVGISTVDGGDMLIAVSGTADALTTAIACKATCWESSTLLSDPAYSCGDPVTEVSLQYLDCVCGSDSWEGNCGSGVEQPLESIDRALCQLRGDCTGDVGAMGTNDVHVMVVSDEGDSSIQLAQGDPDASIYIDAWADSLLGSVSVVGPNYDGTTMTCNSGGATTWGMDRLLQAVSETGGMYAPIADGADCAPTDMGTHLIDWITVFTD